MSKINTLIFDFGDVFINLDKRGAVDYALQLFGMKDFSRDMLEVNEQLEIGALSTTEFLDFYKEKFPNLNEEKILRAWNFILKDFPEYRLNFLKAIESNSDYKLLLLSNTNTFHIENIKRTIPFYDEFKACFDKFYLSHEIGLRKPNMEIFEFIIKENNLKPNQCVFIDDTEENTKTASSMGFHVWNIDEHKEDVVDLFTVKKDLF